MLHTEFQASEPSGSEEDLVGCFGLNGPLRQYFSLYRAVSQREGERKEKRQMREKMSKQPPPAPTASAIGPCPTIIQTSRTPRHWKFTQHLRSTRPPPSEEEDFLIFFIYFYDLNLGPPGAGPSWTLRPSFY